MGSNLSVADSFRQALNANFLLMKVMDEGHSYVMQNISASSFVIKSCGKVLTVSTFICHFLPAPIFCCLSGAETAWKE